MSKRAIGAVWIGLTCGLAFLAFVSPPELAVLLWELVVPAIVSLVVGTFVPSVQECLPWGRAYVRWQERRILQAVHEFEREVEPEEVRETTKGDSPYRSAAVVVRSQLRPSKRRRARQSAIAAGLGAFLTVVITLAITAFLPHRAALAMVMLASGTIATALLAAFASDPEKAVAENKLRVEEGVRKMEADYEKTRVRIEEEAMELEEALEEKAKQLSSNE